MEFEVLFEDNHLLVVNKPAGLLVQGDRTGDECLVDLAKDYIKDKYDKPGAVFLGLVHRLDRPVSGVVALARTSKALTRMNKIFQERKVQKVYWALVSKYPEQEQATLTHWLVKDSSKNKTKAFTKQKQGATKAILSYKILGKSSEGTLLEVLPTTGRPHQIRVQLAQIGCSIVGKESSPKSIRQLRNLPSLRASVIVFLFAL